MKRKRTKYFYSSVKILCFLSAALILFMICIGRRIAVEHFAGMTIGLFPLVVAAVISFLAFSCLPFFKGDRRWYAIPGMLLTLFFCNAAILWNVPVAVA